MRKKQGQTDKDTADRSVGPRRIGVISDTHGFLDPTILDLFAGVVQIIHAGDTGDPAILHALESVAPVVAVAGNVEPPELADHLPREAAGVAAGLHFVVGHKRKRLAKHLAAGDFGAKASAKHLQLAVFGHDHSPSAAWLDGILYLNPGTATAPYEEDDGPTVAIVEVVPTGLAVHFIPLVRQTARDPRRSEADTVDDH